MHGGMLRDTRLALRINVLQMPHRFEASHLSYLSMDSSEIWSFGPYLRTYLHRLVMPVHWTPENDPSSNGAESDPIPIDSEVPAADGHTLRLGWRQHSIDPSQYGVPVDARPAVLWTTGCFFSF